VQAGDFCLERVRFVGIFSTIRLWRPVWQVQADRGFLLFMSAVHVCRQVQVKTMRSGLLLAAVAAGAVLSAPAVGAAIPTGYTFQLQARAATGGSAFNLPSASSFSSISPQINDAGTVSFRVQTVGGTFNPTTSESKPGIWWGGRGSGGIVALGQEGALISSDTHMNQSGYTVWTQGLSSANGIYFYNPAGGSSGLLTNGPLGATGWLPRVNNANEVGSRNSFSGPQVYQSYNAGGAGAVTHAAEVGADASSPYSFLFSPAFDDSRRLAAWVRLGPAGSGGVASRPDQIRRFNSDGSSILIAEDQDSDASSPFNQFDSTTPGYSDTGNQYAFVARTTTSNATRGVFLWDNGSVKTIATPGVGLNTIDSFSPAVNNDGLVAFRATDLSGRISLFLGDGNSLVRLIGVGDTIDTDLGPRTISFLAGNPDINNLGEVAFSAQLSSGGNVVVAAYIPEPGALGLVAPLGMALRRRKRA
jgi:hypothetical protein